MKNLSFTFFLCFFSIISYSQLYIGGVIDGPLTGGTPKAIQICANAAVADMSQYGVGSANNGNGSDGQEFTFPAEAAAAGTCFWINSVADPTNFNAWFGFDPCFFNGMASINGDDAIELFCGGVVIDVFGDINVDGNGECWEYLDGWAMATDNIASTTFACTDYTYSGPNALDGESDNATAATPYPTPAQVCPAVVPVTLVSFSAEKRENAIALNWATASEINNNFFSIEWSQDGKEFTSIAHIEGNGTTQTRQTYSYIHDQDYLGDNNYYRLKQVDHDGAYEYSHTVSVKGNMSKISLRPSIVSSQMTIEGAEVTNYEILSMNGNVVRSASVLNNNTLELGNLASGFYFIRLDLGQGQSETLRFIKQ